MSQVNKIHTYFTMERENLISTYENSIDRLKQRLDEKKAVEKEAQRQQANSEEVKRLSKLVNEWKIRATRYQRGL